MYQFKKISPLDHLRSVKFAAKKASENAQDIVAKTSFCDKTIGCRELIFGTIPIKKCMNILEFFQQNLIWLSGEIFFYLDVWHGMIAIWLLGNIRRKSRLASSDDSKEYAHITSAVRTSLFVTESVIDACLVADERDVLLGVTGSLAVVIWVD